MVVMVRRVYLLSFLKEKNHLFIFLVFQQRNAGRVGPILETLGAIPFTRLELIRHLSACHLATSCKSLWIAACRRFWIMQYVKLLIYVFLFLFFF